MLTVEIIQWHHRTRRRNCRNLRGASMKLTLTVWACQHFDGIVDPMNDGQMMS